MQAAHIIIERHPSDKLTGLTGVALVTEDGSALWFNRYSRTKETLRPDQFGIVRLLTEAEVGTLAPLIEAM